MNLNNGCDTIFILPLNDLILSKYDTNHIDTIVAPCLNNDQLQLIYGSYLGDGHLSITSNNRLRLKIIHCEKQKEYCFSFKKTMFLMKIINKSIKIIISIYV